MQESDVLDLRRLMKRLISMGCHCGGPETVADDSVIRVINDHDLNLADREAGVISCLTRYSALRGFTRDQRLSVAKQIIRFAEAAMEVFLTCMTSPFLVALELQ